MTESTGDSPRCPVLGNIDRTEVLAPNARRSGALVGRDVFGPTCDSLDRLHEPLLLPDDIEPEDYVIFRGMGAYSTATVTRFNGYGAIDVVTVQNLG